jgi:transcriptional regulator with XRE-family HTH domain
MVIPMNKLKAARLRQGLTQTELAYQARPLTPSDISRFETGMARPYPAQAARLAAVLCLPTDQLLADSGETVEVRSIHRQATR